MSGAVAAAAGLGAVLGAALVLAALRAAAIWRRGPRRRGSTHEERQRAWRAHRAAVAARATAAAPAVRPPTPLRELVADRPRPRAVSGGRR